MLSFELILILGICYIGMKIYFQLAKRFKIYDVPNHRTLHDGIIIRGGGIVFPVSVLLYAFIFRDYNWYLLSSLIVISILSFIDDLEHVPTVFRVFVQFATVALILFELNFYETGWVWFFVALVVTVGALNAYNFMDGINGITGGYSFVAIITLIMLNNQLDFASSTLLWSLMSALIVFNFFNFRNNALCFAGDVGSISIAFIVAYFLLKLIIHTQNPIYVLLLAVYGVDSVLTIIHRLLNKENIFEAHRNHLFQIVVYHGKQSHLLVSIAYMIVQALINYIIIVSVDHSINFQIFLSLTILIILGLIYLVLRRYYLKRG